MKGLIKEKERRLKETLNSQNEMEKKREVEEGHEWYLHSMPSRSHC